MLLKFLLTMVSGISLLILVLILVLIFIGIENFLLRRSSVAGVVLLDPYIRFIRGRCKNNCPPPFLYGSCISLLVIFLFIPMGSLPQFVETAGDFVVLIFLLLTAQGLYIRGMKKFSGDLYQSLDTNELYLLSRFAVVLMVVGGTLSWYALNRGMPGNIFSLNTFAATSLWSITGYYGLLGSVTFVLLLAVTSPSRSGTKTLLVDNVPLPEIFDAVRSTICPAIIVSVFSPFKLGHKLGLWGTPMYVIDFFVFWCMVLATQVLVIPLIQKKYTNVKQYFPERFARIMDLIIAVSGIILFMLDLYMINV